MSPPLFDSEYIFGLHDPGGEQIMLDAGRPGWVLFTEGIGHDPNNQSGADYSTYSGRGLGVIVRLNNGYFPEGTIPTSSQYANFAQRCANFVANSRGAKIWIIGNEMNFAIERPVIFRNRAASPTPATPAANPAGDPFHHGAPSRFSALQDVKPGASAFPGLDLRALANEEVITPEMYTRCYRLCRDAIHRIPGHLDDQVLVGAVAPWNNQTIYPGNPGGDWVQYFRDLLTLLGPAGCDGFTLHTYTHGVDPNLIEDETRMNPPYNNRRYHFRTYQDFMQAVPADMRHLPAYISETDQDDPWLDANNGWVQRAYAEIDRWNRQPNQQQIRSLLLYRWLDYDRWGLGRKNGVIEDFRTAMQNNYRWQVKAPVALTLRIGDQVETLAVVNLRRTPGYVGKGAADVIVRLSIGSLLSVLNATPRTMDGLIWWNVRFVAAPGSQSDGWAAQTLPDGAPLIVARPKQEQPAPITGKFKQGDRLVVRQVARLRRTPGYLNKPADDQVLLLSSGAQATVIGGPIAKDNLTWWQVTTAASASQTVNGWVAEAAANDEAILALAPSTPPPVVDVWAVGDLVTVVSGVRVRRSAGYLNKPADDILGDFATRATLNLLEGPRSADNLTWWRVGGILSTGSEMTGWVAQALNASTPLVTRAPKLPGANIPDKITGSYLGAPFQGAFGIAQLWGENPQIYRQITYDGIPLKGHNGIDFLTPNGVQLLAVEDGVVADAVVNSNTGFGAYIRLIHSWGESLYGHLQSLNVRAGQTVTRGMVIGLSDNTGLSFGPHLHFAIRINPYQRTDGWGGFTDPLPYLPPDRFQLPAYVQNLTPTARQALQTRRQSFRAQLQAAPGLAKEGAGVRLP
jgi:murein DD-endopeptidase MepM/ murein hydrolase activator NlpD